MHYRFQQENDHYISIQYSIDSIDSDVTELQLPVWRPGRYEVANFAQKIGQFEIFSNGVPIPFNKTKHSTWSVNTAGVDSIDVRYTFYADQLDAGSSYSDDIQLYVNPVNCCLYVKGRETSAGEIQIDVDKEWKVMTTLQKTEKGKYKFENFHELADSPFIASKDIKMFVFEEQEIEFRLIFQGECRPDIDLITADFKKLIKVQVEAMGDFPSKIFSFFFQIAPYQLYHGVEHLKSTVIALGPGHRLMSEKGYSDLLEISSHELFHCWNVKSIRPNELYPYDYSKENYFDTGFIAEGITTYFGDHFLYQSEIYSFSKYAPLIESNITRHMDNYGRFTKSIAESSFDLWLDGYKKGIPHRKMSIYSDGALLALIADLKIIKATGGDFSLTDAMKHLYQEFAKNKKGISSNDLRNALELVSGTDFEEFFYLINNPVEYYAELEKALDGIGLYIQQENAASFYASRFGFKLSKDSTVIAIHPKSLAAKSGLFYGDKILSVNGCLVDVNASTYFESFKESPEIKISVSRKGRIVRLTLPNMESDFGYNSYKLRILENRSRDQIKCFDKWSLHSSI